MSRSPRPISAVLFLFVLGSLPGCYARLERKNAAPEEHTLGPGTWELAFDVKDDKTGKVFKSVRRRVDVKMDWIGGKERESVEFGPAEGSVRLNNLRGQLLYWTEKPLLRIDDNDGFWAFTLHGVIEGPDRVVGTSCEAKNLADGSIVKGTWSLEKVED